jgi:hypothetical protein
MNKYKRDFYLTNSTLYSEIIKCNSYIIDLDDKAKISVAKSLLEDSERYEGPVVCIDGRKSKPLLNILKMQSIYDLESIKADLANLILQENIEEVECLMMRQLRRYVARATGVNEHIFYGG